MKAAELIEMLKRHETADIILGVEGYVEDDEIMNVKYDRKENKIYITDCCYYNHLDKTEFLD